MRLAIRSFQWLPGALALVMMFPPASPAASPEPTQTIEIQAKRFAFTPSEITVRHGQIVKLVLTSEDVTHTLSVPGLGIRTTIKKGQPSIAEFTADKTGDFQGKCAHFCGRGHGKMTFTIHVTGN